MALNLEQKKAIVTEVTAIASSSIAAVAARYDGLTVTELNELRAQAHTQNITVKVVRNTLAKRALENTEFRCLQDSLSGPLVLVFSVDEPGAAARLVHDFKKKKGHEKLEVKAIVISGQLLGPKDLAFAAQLPSRKEALTLLVLAMKAPMTKWVRTLAEPYAKLTRMMAAVRDQKSKSAVQ